MERDHVKSTDTPPPRHIPAHILTSSLTENCPCVHRRWVQIKCQAVTFFGLFEPSSIGSMPAEMVALLARGGRNVVRTLEHKKLVRNVKRGKYNRGFFTCFFIPRPRSIPK